MKWNTLAASKVLAWPSSPPPENGSACRPAAGHRRQLRGVGNFPDQIQVIALLRPVAQLARRQHLPTPRPAIRRANSTASVPVGVRPPSIYTSRCEGSLRLRSASIASTIRFPRTKATTASATKSGSRNAAEEMLTFAAPAASAASTSPRRPDAAAHRHRNLHRLRHPPQHVKHRPALLHRRRDVQKSRPVRPRRLVRRRARHRIARIDQINKTWMPFTTRPPRMSRHGMRDRLLHGIHLSSANRTEAYAPPAAPRKTFHGEDTLWTKIDRTAASRPVGAPAGG